MTRPALTDFDAYYRPYVGLVEGDDILQMLRSISDETQSFLASIPPERAGHRYAPNKWSIREILSHIIDTERIFAYRALTFAREGEKVLEGYDHDAYVRVSGAERRSISGLAREMLNVRRATIDLFASFDAEMLQTRGIANDKRVTVLAIGYIIAGHDRHHIGVIRAKYL